MDRYPISESEDTKNFHKEIIIDRKFSLQVFFEGSHLCLDDCDYEGKLLRLHVSSRTIEGQCPYCQETSSRVHSRYQRTLRDLPCFGKETIIVFTARKFFCDNKLCRRKTFAEQPGNQIFRYRRRTCRCETTVYRHSLSLSSIQSARLLRGMGITISRSTILRDLHRLRLPETDGLARIGVDDWAFRKGVTYGTIIVDLDSGQVCDMLGTRGESDFSTWLSTHPHVRTVSRDRSTEYSAAIKSTGRDIVEVADRFHLLKNMSECVTKIISANYRSCVDQINGDTGNRNVRTQKGIPGNENLSYRTAPLKEGKGYVNESKYKEVKRLQKEGKNIKETADILGIARQTVRKYRDWESFNPPAKKPRLPISFTPRMLRKNIRRERT